MYLAICLTASLLHLQDHLSVSAMEMSTWWVEQAVMKGEWRCVSMGCGGQCVTMDGALERPQWCANSLDTRTQVSEIIFHISCSVCVDYGLTLMFL